MIDVYEVSKKLIGEIDPIGETNTDEARFENLKRTADLVDKLLTDMDDVLTSNNNAVEYSRKRAADFVDGFFKRLGIEE